MKISISYLPEEEQEAAADLAALRQLHPRAKVRKSEAHPPFKHIYLQISKKYGIINNNKHGSTVRRD